MVEVQFILKKLCMLHKGKTISYMHIARLDNVKNSFVTSTLK